MSTRWTRLHVGYRNDGSKLIEYHLEGTPYRVVRQHPDVNRGGWAIWDEDTGEYDADAYHLEDTKRLAERRAEGI